MAFLGSTGKLYYSVTASDTLSNLTEVPNVQDLAVDINAGTAEASSRSTGGWLPRLPTLREMTITGSLLWEEGDTTVLDALRAAFIAQTELTIAVLSAGKAVSGAQGPRVNVRLSRFSVQQPYLEAVTVDFEFQLSEYIDWEEVA